MLNIYPAFARRLPKVNKQLFENWGGGTKYFIHANFYLTKGKFLI